MSKSFLNGSIVDEAEARILLSDRGFTLADGVFETLRVRAGRVVDAAAHLDRLSQTLDRLGFPPVHREKDVAGILEETRAANGLADGVLRLTVTRGAGVRGLLPPHGTPPTLCVTAAPMPARAPAFTARIAGGTRRNEHSPLSGIKSLGYLDNILALEEAKAGGADDAVLLNTGGRVACFTTANLIARFAERLVTPPPSDGVLPGTVRRRLSERLPVEEVGLTSDALARADEVIAVNSLGVRRLAVLDGRPFPAGTALYDRALSVYDSLT